MSHLIGSYTRAACRLVVGGGTDRIPQLSCVFASNPSLSYWSHIHDTLLYSGVKQIRLSTHFYYIYVKIHVV